MSYGCAGLVIKKERHVCRDLRKTLMFNCRERERERKAYKILRERYKIKERHAVIYVRRERKEIKA